VRTGAPWIGLAALAALAGALALGVLDAQPATARLTLDGEPIRPELAMTSAARGQGLMFRKRAPADGMLFVFPFPTTSGFWMKNTLVPLSVVFFNADGKQVARLLMKPCRSDPCPIYNPKRSYRFALELRAADRRPAKRLGPVPELRRLVARSSY
jgi:hypothetical protein